MGSIKASDYHTVALRNDGTVIATGLNDDGQCDVSGWNNIEEIAVSVYHTVGLKSDGTVVAAGNNKYGQCNVSEWTDIVAIVTGECYTVGLKSDGTVVATGYNNNGQCDVSEWTDIVVIAAEYGHTMGLKSDGTVVATGWNDYGQCDVSEWRLDADAKLSNSLPSATEQTSSSDIVAMPTSTPASTKDQGDPDSASASKELRIEQSHDLMKYVNKYRSDAGVSTLSWNSSLGSDAESYARSWSVGGSSVEINSSIAIARQCNGAKSASKAVSDWMEGNDYVPSYSAALLSSQYTQIGAAMCYLPEGNEYGYHYFWCILLT